MIGPAVIAALEFAGIALVVGDHERAAMRALVMNDPDFALGIAHQHDRLAADKSADVVAGIFHLAFMADVNPSRPEYPLHFEFEDRRIGVEPAMHPAGLHKGVECFGWRHRWYPNCQIVRQQDSDYAS